MNQTVYDDTCTFCCLGRLHCYFLGCLEEWEGVCADVRVRVRAGGEDQMPFIVVFVWTLFIGAQTAVVGHLAIIFISCTCSYRRNSGQLRFIASYTILIALQLDTAAHPL